MEPPVPSSIGVYSHVKFSPGMIRVQWNIGPPNFVSRNRDIMCAMHVVLYEPDIPWNTGNIGRTCVATGSTLHLVGRLGFSLEDKEVRRSGLDYWDKLKKAQYAGWESFESSLPPASPIFLFSKWGKKDFWGAAFVPESYLVFGCETKGLPEAIRLRYADHLYRIPMVEDSVRSLNLSSAVSIVLYEALRQQRSAV
jgi:tRNA (cytidine/uridine-2'-O-)-methyltransferase